MVRVIGIVSGRRERVGFWQKVVYAFGHKVVG
jgi:hypothetical protein